MRLPDTDLGRARHIHQVDQLYPGYLEHHRYEERVDLLDPLRLYNDQLGVLRNKAEYRRLLEERGPLQTYSYAEVVPAASGRASTFRVAPGALREQQAGWKEVFSELDPREDAEPAFDRLIRDRLKILNTRAPFSGSLQAFLTGLVKTLPSSEQPEVFRLPRDEKLQRLERSLGDDLGEKGFQVGRYLRGATSLSGHEAVALAREKARQQEAAARAVELRLVLSRIGGAEVSQGKLFGKVADQERRAESLEPADIEAALGKEGEITSQLKAAELPAEVRAEAQLLIRHLQAADAHAQSGLVPHDLELVEVPPEVAVLRGGDCAIRCSATYTSLPTERTFAIRSRRDGKIKGYLQGTHLGADGQSAFYVHTISGNRFPAQEAGFILDALAASSRQLGVQEVDIPDAANVRGHINRGDIRAEFEARGGETVRLQYKDEGIRAVVDADSPVDYDRASTNQYGRRLVPKTPASRIAVDMKNEARPFFPQEEIPPSRLAEMLLDLQLGGNQPTAQSIAEAAQFNLERLSGIERDLANPRRLPWAEFRAGIEADLNALGIVNPGFFSARESLLDAGRFQAPDALSPANRRETVEAAVRQLSEPGLKRVPADILALIKNGGPGIFSGNPKYRALFRTLYQGDADQRLLLKSLIDRGCGDGLEETAHERALHDLHQGDSQARVRALNFLGHHLSDRIDIATIEAMLADPEPRVRLAAAAALPYPNEAGERFLVNTIADANSPVRLDAVSLLRNRELSPSGNRRVLEIAIRSPGKTAQAIAYQVMMGMTPVRDDSLPLVSELLTSSDPIVRHRMAEAYLVGSKPRPSLLPAAASLLRDNQLVHLALDYLLLWRKNLDLPTQLQLVRSLADPPVSNYLRMFKNVIDFRSPDIQAEITGIFQEDFENQRSLRSAAVLLGQVDRPAPGLEAEIGQILARGSESQRKVIFENLRFPVPDDSQAGQVVAQDIASGNPALAKAAKQYRLKFRETPYSDSREFELVEGRVNCLMPTLQAVNE